MSVLQARLALGAFVALCAGISINALLLQNDPAAIAAAKARAERAQARAELLRARRLSLDRIERAGSAIASAQATSTKQIADSGRRRIARLQQDAARLEVGGPAPGQPEVARRETVKAIQRELTQRGYQPGVVDGVPGLITRAAIMAFEHDQALPVSGEPTEDLLHRIILGGAGPADASASSLPAGVSPHSQNVVRTVQRSLRTLGYQTGRADGLMADETVQAIREFEMDHSIAPTGRISGHLVEQLARLATRGRGKVAAKRK